MFSSVSLVGLLTNKTNKPLSNSFLNALLKQTIGIEAIRSILAGKFSVMNLINEVVSFGCSKNTSSNSMSGYPSRINLINKSLSKNLLKMTNHLLKIGDIISFSPSMQAIKYF